MSLTHLPIYRTAFRLNIYLNDLVELFPKRYHYTLGAAMRKKNTQLWVHIELALVSKEAMMKLKHLKKAQKNLFKIRIYLKLAQTYGLISDKQLSYIFFELNSVGKQLAALVGESKS